MPSFYHQLGSTDLVNSAGDPVDVGQAVRWQNLSFLTVARVRSDWQPGTYLPQAPVDMVVAQLAGLKTAWQDKAERRRYLKQALATLPGGQTLYRDFARGMVRQVPARETLAV